jgi:hypothetical protein
MPGIHVNFKISPEEFLNDLTEAAYEVALKYGFSIPFVDVELDLHKALREVIRNDMKVSPACGASESCQAAGQVEPWSTEADRIFLMRQKQ